MPQMLMFSLILHPQAFTINLENILTQLPINSLAALPPNHELRHLFRQILYLAADSVDRSRTPLLMSQKIVQLLFKTHTQLGREMYAAMLDQLCNSFEDVAKEALTWLVYSEDEVCTMPELPTILRNSHSPSVSSIYQ